MGKEAVEFRGVDSLVYAEVVADTAEEITFGEVKDLAPVAEIARTVSNDNATKYYDNLPMITIKAKGADEVTISSAVVDLPTVAEISGQDYDESLGMMLGGEPENKYFALGYRTKDTGGSHRYVWRLKGQFSEPDETSHTEDDSTDGNGQELVYTGLSTVHKFAKDGKARKFIVVQDNGSVDLSTWFDEVQTPDTVKAKVESRSAAPKAEARAKEGTK
ncbi:major tail protein [Raoultibacter timonensis]|uniref:major tail protein n=1 Tax=Raoultibacter timonensis TaxID=1907662 RepID=UPI0026DA76FD|nr:major tail protein [Raoultibacter timonensis]